MLNSSEIRSMRNTPHRRKAASSTSSLPIKDPSRRHRLGSSLNAAGLDDDDGLGQRHLVRRREEVPRSPIDSM